MNYRRAVSVLLAVSAATMLATGSLGFTSVSADRGVSVNVVDSEDAYVNATACRNGGAVKVTVTNQYSDTFTVERITSGADELPGGKVSKQIIPGNSERFPVSQAGEKVTVHVTGKLTAAVTVTVQERSECPDWGWPGNGPNNDKKGNRSTRQGGPPETTAAAKTTAA
ncbi:MULTISPECIES: hypothetical protein [Halobacterium]|uniref:hypothetical protein n=1 Tax=Halobacterium TaxID=2239 RepID=UPI000AD6CD2A|nr:MULTISPECIES: hypothetical protein [Halobacterium]MCG1004318.1 hypothetical protein [Halobacterium noricense]